MRWKFELILPQLNQREGLANQSQEYQSIIFTSISNWNFYWYIVGSDIFVKCTRGNSPSGRNNMGQLWL